MKSIIKILGIIMILAVVSLSGCIGEDVPADNESEVVVIDEPVDIVVDEPVSDEPEDVVEVEDPVEDEPEEVITSKPSSSGSLVAGVDGITGHGAEIKAKREAAEAAKLAMLNTLADSLPDAIDDANNASADFTELNESYINESSLMEAFEFAANYAVDTNESVTAARVNLEDAEDAFDAEMDTYNASMEAYLNSDELADYTAAMVVYPEALEVYEGDLETYNELLEEFNECEADCPDAPVMPIEPTEPTMPEAPVGPAPVSDNLQEALDTAILNEEAASELLEHATENLGDVTADSIESLMIAVEEAQITLDEAIAFREECKAAFDLMHPVTETEE